MPPTYRERLRTEGLALALCGAVATGVLLVASPEAQRNPRSTVAQLAAVALLLAWLGPRSARHALATSEPRAHGDLGSGQPTTHVRLVLVVIALAAAAGSLGGWDAGLRVTLGCVLVGLAQALVLARIVAANERDTGRTHFRVPGSRILRGTRLGHLDSQVIAHAGAGPSGLPQPSGQPAPPAP